MLVDVTSGEDLASRVPLDLTEVSMMTTRFRRVALDKVCLTPSSRHTAHVLTYDESAWDAVGRMGCAMGCVHDSPGRTAPGGENWKMFLVRRFSTRGGAPRYP